MREILFRGKRTGDHKWVEGNLEYHPITKLAFIRMPKHIYISIEMVDPVTVGQYTNQIDKNGVKIFEGDICRHRVVVDGEVMEDDVGNVCLRHGSWTIMDKLGYIAVGQCSPESLEVIGNIHDTPELLEARDEH